MPKEKLELLSGYLIEKAPESINSKTNNLPDT